MGLREPEIAAAKAERRRRTALSRPPQQPSTNGHTDALSLAPKIAGQVTRARGVLSAKQVVALQRLAGNTAVGETLQRDSAAPPKSGARVNLDLGWLDMSGGGIQTNEQLAAVARLAVASLKSDLVDIESDQLKTDAKRRNHDRR
jgi:hypothetical protein